MTDRELAGCPCCGKPARFSDEYQNADGEWAVECSACNLLSWTVEDWNRRTSSSEGDGRDAEDAARWRWAKKHFRVIGLEMSGQHHWAANAPFGRVRGPTIDAAIDAAIAAAAGGGDT